ncbi:MAG: hypothetical protein ACC645_09260, partial [Pirellulales bacterium]
GHRSQHQGRQRRQDQRQRGISLAISDNRIDNDVLAYIDNSTIDVAEAVSISAETLETNLVNSGAVAASIAASISLASAGLSGGGAGATNEVTNSVKAYIDGDSTIVIAGGGVAISASDNATIESDVGVVAIGGGVVGASIGISWTDNSVDNDVHAYIDSKVNVTTGGIDIMADSTAYSEAVGFATSVAIGAGAFAGAGTDLNSTIAGSVKAYVGPAGDLTIASSGTGGGELNILATTDQQTLVDAAGTAIAAGAGVTVGVSLADAAIQGSTQAYLAGSLTGGDALNIIADNTSDADATSFALAGGSLGLVGSGAGTTALAALPVGVPAWAAYRSRISPTSTWC